METTLDHVAGFLRCAGGPKSPAQMDEGVTLAVRRRHASVDTNILVRLLTPDDAGRTRRLRLREVSTEDESGVLAAVDPVHDGVEFADALHLRPRAAGT